MYLAARSWGLAPSEFWAMTIGEMSAEVDARGSGETYAGGMTEGDIEEIKSASAELKEKRAKASVTSPA